MNDLKKEFTNWEIMEEYTKICARLGFSTEAMNCLLHSPIFKTWGADDFGKAMIDHYKELKRRKHRKRISTNTIRQIVIYGTAFTEQEVRTKNKKLRDSKEARNALTNYDTDKDYLKN